MKAYVHFDGSPEFTVVFREAGNLTVQELLAWFASKYETRHGFKLAIGKLLASCGESRRQLDNKDIVRKVVRSCSDVYVKLCDTGSAGENTPASGPSEWEQPSPGYVCLAP